MVAPLQKQREKIMNNVTPLIHPVVAAYYEVNDRLTETSKFFIGNPLPVTEEQREETIALVKEHSKAFKEAFDHQSEIGSGSLGKVSMATELARDYPAKISAFAINQALIGMGLATRKVSSQGTSFLKLTSAGCTWGCSFPQNHPETGEMYKNPVQWHKDVLPEIVKFLSK